MARDEGEPRVRACDQSGVGLVEVLVALVLASLTVLALAQALFTLVATSRATADRQQLSSAANGYGESLKQITWIACGPGGGPDAQAWSNAEATSATPFDPPRGVTLSVTRVEYWNAARASFDATCPTDGTRAQRISVRASSNRRSFDAQVVKVPW
ncbi:MAG: hypothetical protein JST64_01685 [Actinobacteria bacterium]|nr:hypothetical protein [Actinomycetota bacterium]